MTHKEFCAEITPIVCNLKNICKDMTPVEFQTFKQKAKEMEDLDELCNAFLDEVFYIIDPNKELVYDIAL
ncbi:hypothetical protein [Anaerostipes sp.]|uniref:hypothetical protein n=1 Tax=Anaerostipes sp. TaxID=1872530 RepID=UPI0025C374D9|nr:hypothetical protein [Anaerostipes sp.]MBS7006799.1 hypothetical protein [Anaerostipes sp.]